MRDLEFIDRPVDGELGRFWAHRFEILALFPYPAIEAELLASILIGRDIGGAQWDNSMGRYFHRATDKVLKTFFNLKARTFLNSKMRERSNAFGTGKIASE